MGKLTEVGLILTTSMFIVTFIDGQETNNCNSSREFEVAWWNAPPFIMPDEENNTGKIVGPLVDLLNQAVRNCCHPGSKIVFPHRFASSHEMDEEWNVGTFAVPAVRGVLLQAFHVERKGVVMIPIIESPGAMYFKNTNPENTGTTMAIILTGWPLLLLVIISAGFAGVVMWLLDTNWNPEQFPRPFLRGTSEGFWWAFVTMTTVGYGDRAPTSFLGKFFAILWILAGIIILSIFTAAVTTALSAGADSDNDPLSGHKIGVMHGSEEVKLVFAEGGLPVEYRNISALMEDVCEGEKIHGAFLEFYAFTFLHLLHGEGCLRRVRTIKNPVMYGILTQGVGGGHVEANVSDCFMEYITRRRHRAFDSLEEHIISLQNLKSRGGADVSTEIFQGVNMVGLGVSVAILGVIMVAGILWEQFYWKPKQEMQEGHCQKERVPSNQQMKNQLPTSNNKIIDSKNPYCNSNSQINVAFNCEEESYTDKEDNVNNKYKNEDDDHDRSSSRLNSSRQPRSNGQTKNNSVTLQDVARGKEVWTNKPVRSNAKS